MCAGGPAEAGAADPPPLACDGQQVGGRAALGRVAAVGTRARSASLTGGRVGPVDRPGDRRDYCCSGSAADTALGRRPPSAPVTRPFDGVVKRAQDSAAVMIVMQADPGFDQSDVTRAPLRDPKTPPSRRPARRVPGLPDRAPRRDDRLPQAGRPRVRRFPLLPDRQAAPRRPGAAARELHPRRDLRRQRRQRPERRAVGQGARRPEESRRLRVPAADRAGKSRRGPRRRDPRLGGRRAAALCRGPSPAGPGGRRA